MGRRIVYATALLSILLLTGCNGRSISYLMTRAFIRLTTPPLKLPVLTSTPATIRFVTLQNETPTLPASEKPTKTIIEQFPSVSGKITASYQETTVNVRGGPSVVNAPIGSLVNGQIVEVTGRSPRGEWFRVKTERLEGWVHSAFVLVENPQVVPCIRINAGDCTSPGD